MSCASFGTVEWPSNSTNNTSKVCVSGAESISSNAGLGVFQLFSAMITDIVEVDCKMSEGEKGDRKSARDRAFCTPVTPLSPALARALAEAPRATAF